MEGAELLQKSRLLLLSASKGGGASDGAHGTAVPGSCQRARRLLLAMALAVRADWSCPHSLVAADDSVQERLVACLAAASADSNGSVGASAPSPAARALLLYGVCSMASPSRALAAVQAAYEAALLLANTTAAEAAERQLARLQAAHEPHVQHTHVLSMRQLQHACWWRVAEAGADLLAYHRSPALLLHTGNARLSAAQLAEVEGAVATAAVALPLLEPDSVKGLLAAGGAHASLRRPETAARLYLAALQAARRQQSAYWELRAAAALFSGPAALHVHASAGELHLSGATMQAAAVALFLAGPTLQMCEQALPAAWAMRLQAEVSRGRRRARAAQVQLNIIQQVWGVEAVVPRRLVLPAWCWMRMWWPTACFLGGVLLDLSVLLWLQIARDNLGSQRFLVEAAAGGGQLAQAELQHQQQHQQQQAAASQPAKEQVPPLSLLNLALTRKDSAPTKLEARMACLGTDSMNPVLPAAAVVSPAPLVR